MKLAYHGATSRYSDLATDIRASAHAGFVGIEAWAGKFDDYLREHSLTETAALFKENGVEAVSINSIEFIGFRGAEYENIRKRCKQLCEVAESIGCSKLVVVPSPTPAAEGGSVLELFYPWGNVVDEYVNVLRDLAEIAGEHGVGLCFEFIGFSWCSVRTPRGAYEIVQQADRDNIGINFDCCHFYGGGGELNELDLIDPARIYTFHLNDIEDAPKEAITDAMRLLPGLGVIDLDGICAKLKAIGYDGTCSIELFRPEYWDWDPYELAVKARESAITVLSPYFDLE
ncbi:MAG: sugar phosphate isomerase/epimerase family protein [Armatimonadota bacterium]